MKKPQFLLIIAAVIIVAAIVLRFSQKAGEPANNAEFLPEQGEEMLGGDRDEHGCIGSAGYSWCEVKSKCLRSWEEPCQADEVIVSSPQPGELIVSPLRVTGQARGGWFFEANLPLRITDQSGTIIASHYATAQSDWMTAEFVPFSGDIEFTTTATSGYLIISKDNPSGLEANAADFVVPVRFK